MIRKSYPGGAMPYSAALISLSVPSTPTRSTFTSTPRPWGTSATLGRASSARCIEFGVPGWTATAFMVGTAGCSGRLRVGPPTAAPPRRSVLGMSDSFGFYELNRVTVGVARQDGSPEAERCIGQLDGLGGHQ